MATHDLKIESRWFERVVSGEKCAEVRRHDRDFQVGDTLHMTEVNDRGYPVRHNILEGELSEGTSSREAYVDVFVTHVLDGRLAPGLADDYCVLSITNPVTGFGD